jgi:hypothetical protein
LKNNPILQYNSLIKPEELLYFFNQVLHMK